MAFANGCIEGCVCTGELAAEFEFDMLLVICLIRSRSAARCWSSIPSNFWIDSRWMRRPPSWSGFSRPASLGAVAGRRVSPLEPLPTDELDTPAPRAYGLMGEDGTAPMGRMGDLFGTFMMPLPFLTLFTDRMDVNERRVMSATFPIGFLRSKVNCGTGSAVTKLGAGDSCGVEWFPSRIIDGRELELDARFEIACVRGSTYTCAVSTGSDAGERGGGGGLYRLRACSAPSSESSSSLLSSDVSRSSIAFAIVD